MTAKQTNEQVESEYHNVYQVKNFLMLFLLKTSWKWILIKHDPIQELYYSKGHKKWKKARRNHKQFWNTNVSGNYKEKQGNYKYRI